MPFSLGLFLRPQKYSLFLYIVGKLEDWKVGRLESWKVGKLEGWEVGKLESQLVIWGIAVILLKH
jgi:hypothetical protein